MTTYNIATKSKVRVTPEFPNRKFTGAAAWAPYHDSILLTGGLCVDAESVHNNYYVTHVWKVNPNTWSFSQLADMNNARGGHAMVGVHGNMFVIGGYNNEDMSECEVFVGDYWTPICNL